FGSGPVVLNLVYFDCPNMCPESLNGLVRALRTLKELPGREFQVLTVSFDPNEGPGTASAQKESMLKRYGRGEARGGWHFLTGDKQAIERLTQAVGFRFAFDDASKRFAHSSGLVVL